MLINVSNSNLDSDLESTYNYNPQAGPDLVVGILSFWVGVICYILSKISQLGINRSSIASKV